MDKTTLADPAVTAALSNYVKVKFQAEDPRSSRRSPVTRFKASPTTYVVLRPTPSLIAHHNESLISESLIPIRIPSP